MPHGRFDELVPPDCVVRRAGFADLVAARGVTLPAEGSFRERFGPGSEPVSRVLRNQRATVERSAATACGCART
jgi:hypothetical protein